MTRFFASCGACAVVLAFAAAARAQSPPPPQLPPPPPPPPSVQGPPSLPPPPPPPPGSETQPPGQGPRGGPAPRGGGGGRGGGNAGGGYSGHGRGGGSGSGNIGGGSGQPPVTLYVSEVTRVEDAHVDRVMLASTAETHPEGTFYVSDYDIAAAQIGYAFTDRAQLAISFAPSIFSHQPYFADVSLKANLHRGQVVRAAMIVGFDAVAFPGRAPENFLGVRGGGVVQLCFELACRSSLSLNGSLLLSNRTSQVVPLLFSAGLVVHLSPLVKLLAEPSFSGVLGQGALEGPRGFMFGYGVRLSQREWGLDLGFVKPVDPNDNGPIGPGYPFIAATWRSTR